MNTLESYIKQVCQKPIFSSFQLVEFISNGAGLLSIDIDHSQQGANLILLHSVIIDIPANAAIDNKLIDKVGRIYMSFTQTVEITGQYQFRVIMDTPRIQLVLTNSIGFKGKMTAIYQYIYNSEKE